MTAEILMATPCTKSLGYESVGGTSVQEMTISHMLNLSDDSCLMSEVYYCSSGIRRKKIVS